MNGFAGGFISKKRVFRLTLFGGLLNLVTSPFAQTVTLRWDTNREPNITYQVHWGTASRTYSTNRFEVGTVTTYTVTNLLIGTNYYFAVTAKNMAGLVSDFSNEVVTRITN